MQYGYAALRVYRRIQRGDDPRISLGIDRPEGLQVLSEGLSGDRQSIQVQHGAKPAYDGRYSSRPIQIQDVIGAARPQVDQMRRLPAELIEAIQTQIQAELRSDRRHVQHGIGGCLRWPYPREWRCPWPQA